MPDFIQFSQILLALLFEVDNECARGNRPFPCQMLHSQIHIVNSREDPLDAMQPLCQPNSVRPKQRRKKLCQISRFAQKNPEFVQFLCRA